MRRSNNGDVHHDTNENVDQRDPPTEYEYIQNIATCNYSAWKTKEQRKTEIIYKKLWYY